MKTKVIIDCDPGMDDSLALILAVKSPSLSVEAITTVTGNLHVSKTLENARKTLEVVQAKGIPVAGGMEKPLVRDWATDPFSHGGDGLGETNLPAPSYRADTRHAVDLIIETVKQNPGEITLIATAPLTNLAVAFLKAPEIRQSVKRIVALAGSYGLNSYSFTNATGDNPQSEWNVYVDPEAARIVFGSGIPLTAVGLDVATAFDINFTERDFHELEASARPEAAYLLRMVRFVLNRGFQSYCVLIDSLAVAAVIDPSLVETMEAYVGIETRGELTLGQTVIDRRHHFTWTHLPKVEVVCKVDYERFLRMFVKTILT